MHTTFNPNFPIKNEVARLKDDLDPINLVLRRLLEEGLPSYKVINQKGRQKVSWELAYLLDDKK